MAEWLGKGLQNPVRRFESARHLEILRWALALRGILHIEEDENRKVALTRAVIFPQDVNDAFHAGHSAKYTPLVRLERASLNVVGRLDLLYLAACQSILILIPGHRRNGRLSLDHRDAFLNRTDDGAEVAADARVLNDFVPVCRRCKR